MSSMSVSPMELHQTETHRNCLHRIKFPEIVWLGDCKEIAYIQDLKKVKVPFFDRSLCCDIGRERLYTTRGEQMEEVKDVAKGVGIGLAFGAIGTIAKRKAESNIGRPLPHRIMTAIRGLSLAGLIYGVAGYPKSQNKTLPIAIGGAGLGLGITALPDKCR